MRAALAAACVTLAAGCKCVVPAGHTVFGSDLPSRDGGTTLTVARSGVGPGCVLVLDGKPWGTLDAKLPLSPGRHTVGCRDAEELTLDVVAGHDVVVDYWGP